MFRALVFVLFLGLFLMPSSGQAGDQLLTLFPKGRAAHQTRMDDAAAKYEARGHSYVDHLYATGAEEPMSELEDLDIDLNEDDTIPVDAAAVADIIKQDPAVVGQ